MADIGVVFVSDRADRYLPGAVESVLHHLNHVGPFGVIDDRDHRLGLAGAARTAWEWAAMKDVDYLFHMEEDFRLVEDVNLDDMVAVLDADPTLAQVVLKRQPWSPEEHQAGGIIECHPDDYEDHKDGELRWVTHSRIFSLNPCLIPRHIVDLGWPDSNEAGMTEVLVGAGYRFAFFGGRHDPPRVVHVGGVRGAGWRL